MPQVSPLSLVECRSMHAQHIVPDSILGPAIQQAIQQRIQQRPGFHLGWQLADQKELSQFKLTPDGQGVNVSEYASNLVRDQTVWGAVVIHPNATRLAIEAAQQGISTYDPRGSIAFYYEEARNIFSNLLWVLRFTTDTLSFGISQASSQFATQLINASNGTALSTAAPIISTPFGFSEFNLVPFNKLGAEAPTTAGTIYVSSPTVFSKPPVPMIDTAACDFHLLYHSRVENNHAAFSLATHFPVRNAVDTHFTPNPMVLGVSLL